METHTGAVKMLIFWPELPASVKSPVACRTYLNCFKTFVGSCCSPYLPCHFWRHTLKIFETVWLNNPFMVYRTMSGLAQHLQVLWSVVTLYAIQMMNHLIRFKVSPKCSLNHKAVFLNITTAGRVGVVGPLEKNITVGNAAPTFPHWAKFLSPVPYDERSEGLKLVLVSFNNSSATTGAIYLYFLQRLFSHGNIIRQET